MYIGSDTRNHLEDVLQVRLSFKLEKEGSFHTCFVTMLHRGKSYKNLDASAAL